MGFSEEYLEENLENTFSRIGILGAISFRRILPGRVFQLIQPWSTQQVISAQSVIDGCKIVFFSQPIKPHGSTTIPRPDGCVLSVWVTAENVPLPIQRSVKILGGAGITYIQGDVVKEEIAHSDMYRQAKEYILSDNKGKNPFYAITVASYALWFKNKGFEQENEIRFMLPSFFDGHGFDMEDLGKCEYVRNSIVKSYYKLNLQAAAACAAKKKNAETFWSAISSITLGPRSKQNPDIFKGYLQDVLGKNGFSGVHIAVKPSACSLR